MPDHIHFFIGMSADYSLSALVLQPFAHWQSSKLYRKTEITSPEKEIKGGIHTIAKIV
jgi:hypothetical protein